MSLDALVNSLKMGAQRDQQRRLDSTASLTQAAQRYAAQQATSAMSAAAISSGAVGGSPGGWGKKFNIPGGLKGNDLGSNVVRYAEKFVGTPYVWGGNSLSKGVDCSGLVQQVYKHFGYSLPRTSQQQTVMGHRAPIGQLKPGDLIGFGNYGSAHHVAIYAGHGMVVEAPHTGLNVRVRPLSSNEGAWGVRLNYH